MNNIRRQVIEESPLGIYVWEMPDGRFAEQKQRLEWGLVPDPFDIGNYKDEIKKLGKLK